MTASMTPERLEQIKSEHEVMMCYQGESKCPNQDEDHADNRHVEAENDIGELICLDMPVGETCVDCDYGNPICEVVELIREIERLQWEQELILQTVDSVDGSLGEHIRKESAERWKEES